jgi:DNA polymerase III epsilon subunit-like protein/signal recognition particle GTPase
MTRHLCLKNDLPTPSKEQLEIITAVNRDFNVMVNAVAGSGKTTTINLIAKNVYPKKVLVVTYNRRLMDESNLKAKRYDLDNIDVRTYHALCSRLYNPAPTDRGMIEALNAKVKNHSIDYDIVIIDEGQDCKSLFYKFVVKVLNDNTKNAQLIILGDIKQNIYAFNGTDGRYLSLADKILQNKKDWVSLTLTTSYRLTPAVAGFVNNCLLGSDLIIGGNTKCKNIKPEYHMVLGFDDGLWDQWVDDFKDMMKDNKYKYEDVFIIASSITQKSKFMRSPVTRLENALVRSGIKCNAVTSDDEQLKEDTMRGKVVFSTFHSVKGLERKVVIVLGMEDFFYNLGCNKNEPLDSCPNIIYVACTRSLEKLILVHNAMNNYLPFLNQEQLPNYTTIKKYGVYHPLKDKLSGNKEDDKTIGCKDFIKHINEDALDPFDPFWTVRKKAQNNPGVKAIIATAGDQYENVSDINGVAIVEHAVMPITKRINIREILLQKYGGDDDGAGADKKLPKEHLKFIKPEKKFKSIKHMLKLANIYLSYCGHGFLFKVAQLNTYDFLSQEMADTFAERIRSNITTNGHLLETETNLKHAVDWSISKNNGQMLTIYGRSDIIDHDNKVLWEVKCKHALTSSDRLQLIIYAVCYGKADYKYKLINTFTGEILELTYDDSFADLLAQIVCDKYRSVGTTTDAEFIESNTCSVSTYVCGGAADDDDFDDNSWESDDVSADFNLSLDADADADADADDADMSLDAAAGPATKDTYVMVVDTETTGTSVNQHRISSICWKLFDNNGVEHSSDYYIVKPDGFNNDNHPRAVVVHKITQAMALAEGIPMKIILQKFERALEKSYKVVAHNIAFDSGFIMKEAGIIAKFDLIRKFSELDKYCTMSGGKCIVNAKNIKGQIKNPKLTEMYQHFFEGETFDAHDARNDVMACARCYFKMIVC